MKLLALLVASLLTLLATIFSPEKLPVPHTPIAVSADNAQFYWYAKQRLGNNDTSDKLADVRTLCARRGHEPVRFVSDSDIIEVLTLVIESLGLGDRLRDADFHKRAVFGSRFGARLRPDDERAPISRWVDAALHVLRSVKHTTLDAETGRWLYRFDMPAPDPKWLLWDGDAVAAGNATAPLSPGRDDAAPDVPPPRA